VKILFASHSAALAGAEQSLLHLVREATERGHTGTVVLPEPGPLADRLREVSESFNVLILPNRLWIGRRFNVVVGAVRLMQAISDVPRYLAHLRSGNYAAVVVNSSVSPVPLIAARLAKVPVLQIVRESLLTNPMLKSALPKSIVKRLIHTYSSSVICISQYVAAQYSYPCQIVYPQVDRRFFGTNSKRPPIQDLPPFRAVICGTLSPEKGQADAVRAISIARSLGTDVELDIYGDGRAQDIHQLESLIDHLKVRDFVKLRGSTSDMLSVYQGADVAVVCSRNEGFGKVTAEAVLTGRPVIAYGLGGTSEILEYGGGILTAPSPNDMGAALHRVFAQPGLLARLQDEAHASPIRTRLSRSAQLVIDSVEELRPRQTH